MTSNTSNTLSLARWEQTLQSNNSHAPHRQKLLSLQVNLGYYCNMACSHCHVDASPKRIDEVISAETCKKIIHWMQEHRPTTLDLTGGAPELIEGFRDMVIAASTLNITVLDRNNLTCFFEKGQEDLGAFLAQHNVTVIASLPCYTLDNVDKQRGRGTFDKSIEALKLLNNLGYGNAAPWRVF